MRGVSFALHLPELKYMREANVFIAGICEFRYTHI